MITMKNGYDLLSVKTALETLYAQGYKEISLQEFLILFCEKYDLSLDDEKRKILSMLRVLERNNVVTMKNKELRMWNMLSSNLRLIINK